MLTRSLDPKSAATAFVKALLPEGATVGGGDERTVELAGNLVSELAPRAYLPWLLSHEALSVLARIQTGRRLEQLDQERASALVLRWASTPLLSGLVHTLGTVYKLAHFHRADIRGSLRDSFPRIEEERAPRWFQNVLTAADVDDEIECDAVVVGTGAGGAVVGRELAARGHAVVFVEEGQFKRRGDYPGSLVGALTELYETTVTVGNCPIVMPRGRLVGGSTAVNGGSSFRPPVWVTERWVRQLGSDEFSLDGLSPHYEAVENFLQVEPPTLRAAGPFHQVFAEGCRRLGWHNDLVPRNAPGCQGEGFCDTGCRSGARRSTEVSYVPDALSRGAVLVTGCAVDEILHEGGRAIGVAGYSRLRDGATRRFRVRARAVILAAGSLKTPLLLHENGIGDSSGELGRNLTVHPSGGALALYDQVLDVAEHIPQADFSSQFLREGLLLLTAHPAQHVLPTMLSDVGGSLMQKLDERRRIAGTGFLASDHSMGRVHLGLGSRGLVSYHVGRAAAERFHRAQILLAELSLACGARESYPGLRRPFVIRSRADLAAFSSLKLGASDFALTAFHPLGTCRMSPVGRSGVVDLNHETFELGRLFVVDGSVVPGPLGVNPQLTIMAFARRAAEKIDRLLEAPVPAPRQRPQSASLPM